MKVFLISNMYPSKKDALFGVFIKNFREELEKNNVSFTGLALIKGKSKNILIKLLRYFFHYIKIFIGFFNVKYEVMYIHYVSHHIPILWFLLPLKTKPWVLNAHGDDILSLQRNKIFNYFAKQVLKKADLIVVPTPYFKEKVLRNYPFLNNNGVFVSPSGGVNTMQFYPKKTKPENRFFTVGFVSRFIEEKGWKTFLDALAVLKNQTIPFKAIMAGKGPDEMDIKHYIQKQNLNDEVDFLGFVKQQNLVHLYNQFDLYIFPTYREAESLGLTGVEAMSCGTAVVACNISGPSTYVDHGKNGYLFEPKNHLQLAEILKNHQSLPIEKRKEFSENALQRAAEFEQGYVAKNLLKRIGGMVKTERQ